MPLWERKKSLSNLPLFRSNFDLFAKYFFNVKKSEKSIYFGDFKIEKATIQ